MKSSIKSKFFKAGAVSILALSSVGGALPISTLLGGNILVAEAAATIPAGAVEVRTIQEFENALMDANVTNISVKASFKFRKNITNIPNRDVTVYGNKDEGFTIDSARYSIYGKQNTKGRNTFSVVDAKITGDQTVGRFFTGGAGNGPSSYGWDVAATDIVYTGARFVHLSEGKLTFDGTNDIKTRAENAWVHDLEFKPNSVYNGEAASKDHGQYSAFYFNGALINGQATGKVDIGNGAKVNVVISPQSNVNYYYPVFYDKVYQVNVGEKAELNVDAAGVAFQFIPRADYKNIPSLNLAMNSVVKLNGRGGGNYATMKLQEYGSQINMDTNSELVIDGNSKKGVVESIYEFASFNLNKAKNLEIANHMPGQNIFYADRTFIRAVDEGLIRVWEKTGGDYPDADRLADFLPNRTFSTYVGLRGDAKDNEVTAEVFGSNADTIQNFQTSNYGKIKFTRGAQ